MLLMDVLAGPNVFKELLMALVLLVWILFWFRSSDFTEVGVVIWGFVVVGWLSGIMSSVPTQPMMPLPSQPMMPLPSADTLK